MFCCYVFSQSFTAVKYWYFLAHPKHLASPHHLRSDYATYSTYIGVSVLQVEEGGV